MTFCKCGCGQEIIIKKHHKYIEIPEYIRGHFFRGKKHSPEHIEKIRQKTLGRKFSPETIEKMKQGKLGRKLSPEHIEKIRQGKLGRKFSPEHIEKIRQAHTPKVIEKIRQKTLGRKQSPEHIEKRRQGKLNIFSALERNIIYDYCPLFNNEIRAEVRIRDDFTCQYCGKKQSELIGFHKQHSVHHIHYDKKNCFPDLITLCMSCNIKANKNRDEWEKIYMNKLNDRNLLLWTKCRNKQNYNDEETI